MLGREGSPARAKAAGFDVARARGIFRRVDIISLHYRLTRNAAYRFTRDDLGRNKATGLLVNRASGLIAKGRGRRAQSGRPGKRRCMFTTKNRCSAPINLLKMTMSPARLIWLRHAESYEEYYATVVDDIVAFLRPANPTMC